MKRILAVGILLVLASVVSGAPRKYSAPSKSLQRYQKPSTAKYQKPSVPKYNKPR
jgi:hypothetical protein